MEEVWRSYGPLEPIGPEAKRSRSNRALIAGIGAVCLAGAAAGMWLQLGGERAEAPAAKPEGRRVTAAEGDLARAARLQAELELTVAQSSPQPMGLDVPAAAVPAPPDSVAAYPVPAYPVQAYPVPAVAPAAPPTPSVRTPAPRSIAPPAAPQRRAVRSEPAGPPMVIAAASPTPQRHYPRTTPPVVRPAPPVARPAPPPQVVAAPAPPRPRGPSYDCAQAREGAERIVCDSPELAALDRRLVAELNAAVAAGHNPAELNRDQADWRRRRDAAAPDPRAVADVYQRRIGQLRSMQ